MRRILLYVLYTLLSTSCSTFSGIPEIIIHAEELMPQNPDSALFLLGSLNTGNINSQKIRAKYAVVYSQALDKNYIDKTNDSLITIAVKYYKKHGNIKEKFMSLYYLGRIQYNAGHYTRAMLSYMEAIPLIEQLDDDYLSGLLFSQISQIYANNFEYANSLNAAEEAYKYFLRTKYVSHQHYALLDIGLAYANNGQKDKSIDILNQVVQLARENADTILLASCLSNLALQSIESRDCEKTKKLYHEKASVLGEPLDMRDNACLAYVYALESKRDSVSYYMNKAWPLACDKIDTVALFFRSFQIEKVRGNYRLALENLEKSVQIQDSIVRETLQQSVVSAQKDYFLNLSDFRAFKLKTEKRLWILAFAFLIFIVIVAITYLHRRLQQKNLEISKYMNMTFEIQDTLRNHDTQMSQLIQRLFNDKFELIDKLGCTYYERQNTPAEKEAIFNAVKSAIQDLGSDKKTKMDLERIVDACNNNVMFKIREQMPNLKESDYELLCYFFARFSYRAISIFTQDKVENIYNKKSRLKSRISNSEPRDMQLFLEMLG